MKTEASMNTKPCGNCGHHRDGHCGPTGTCTQRWLVVHKRDGNWVTCPCVGFVPSPADGPSVAEKKAAVLARWPKAYVCSEVYEDAVFITLGPGRDLSAKFDTEDAAWCDAYDRMFKLPLTQEGAPECQASGQACHYESVGPNKSVQCVYCGNPVPASVPVASPEGERRTWPTDCVQRAFVEGAKWWQFTRNGSTMFGSERDQCEAEAVSRYGAVQASRASLPVGELDDVASFIVHIDERPYSIPRPAISVGELKSLAGITPQYQIFMECGSNRPDVPLNDASMVGDGYKLYAVPPATFNSEAGILPNRPMFDPNAYGAVDVDAYIDAVEAQLLTTQAALAQAEEKIAGLVKERAEARDIAHTLWYRGGRMRSELADALVLHPEIWMPASLNQMLNQWHEIATKYVCRILLARPAPKGIADAITRCTRREDYA